MVQTLTDKNIRQGIIVIVGPTAVGKTEVAVRVADEIGGEIVSADSRQVYRGLEIGTGAPTPEQLRRAKHHLVGFIDPDKRLSAGEFAKMARSVIEDVRQRGKVPLIVGGSGLYIKAMIDGLSPVPPVDIDVRIRIHEEIKSRGMEEMLSELRSIDPEYAQKVGINDRKRLIRALEVWRMTGKNFSDWHMIDDKEAWCEPMIYGLARPRGELCNIIQERINNMLNEGWVEEVNTLALKYGRIENLPPTVREALGYADIVQYIQGKKNLKETVESITISTRQFAKRQMTWFKADKRIQWREESGDKAVFVWTEWIIRIINELDLITSPKFRAESLN